MEWTVNMAREEGEPMQATEAVVATGQEVGQIEDFMRLVEPFLGDAYRLAVALVQDRELAEDAVQEASVRAWRRLASLRDPGAVRPWLLAIVANECRSQVRRQWRRDVLFASLTRLGLPSQRDPSQVDAADVRVALSRLSFPQRQVVALHYYLDVPIEEVAAMLGLASGTVKSRLSRGMARVREYVRIQEEDAQ
jgi:RNA polymerase sigma factor (sigma-70 family)